MPKFKVGDHVRCASNLGGSTGGYRNGETYVVKDTFHDFGERIHTLVDSNGSTTNGWGVEHFELVHSAPRFSHPDDFGYTDPRPRGSDLQPQTPEVIRTFGTGATRDLDANKLDFEGFLSPLVLERYAEHMHKARAMADGTMRDSDNWTLGIPQDAYMKSMWRHFFDVWKTHRGYETASDIETELCALLFNASGMLHEILKAKKK